MQLVLKRVFASFLAFSVLASSASAETISGALAKAYQLNSSLNSARAGVRVTDENVPLAKSGYRPVITGTGSAGYSSTKTTATGTNRNLFNQVSVVRNTTSERSTFATFGVEISQMLFDGFQTRNRVAAAKASVRAARENLRNSEQNTLMSAATVYMDVIRDRRIADLTQRNVAALSEQVRAANSRLEVGEGTRTDVAQADAARANAVALSVQARAAQMSSEATYRQVIGEKPGKLNMPGVLSKSLPRSLDAAFERAALEHPAILANMHLIDASDFDVKTAEGALLPRLDATAGITQSYGDSKTAVDDWGRQSGYEASIGARLTVPIYQGGAASARVRQNKELLGQSRIELDVARDQVRQAVAQSWNASVAAREGARANRELVAAQQLALNGVIEERNVGQRTTLDVLNAQAELIQAQINLAQDEHDAVTAGYAVLSAVGRLSAQQLGLNVAKYDPKEHYEAVKDKWFGLRTPDGR